MNRVHESFMKAEVWDAVLTVPLSYSLINCTKTNANKSLFTHCATVHEKPHTSSLDQDLLAPIANCILL